MARAHFPTTTSTGGSTTTLHNWPYDNSNKQHQMASPPNNNNEQRRNGTGVIPSTIVIDYGYVHRPGYGLTPPPPRPPNPSALKMLQKELKSLHDDPVEGFKVTCAEENMFKWNVAIFGPPGTPYAGGYFKATLDFPNDFPFSPPMMQFTPPLYHMNVYKDGRLCISILHPPGNDPFSSERADEKWSPARSVRSVLLSVIALLNDQNPESPANIDAAVSYRRYREHGDPTFMNMIRDQVERSREEARKDNVTVPETQEQYLKSCSQRKPSKAPDDITSMDMNEDDDNDEENNDEDD